jgi:MFS family permease
MLDPQPLIDDAAREAGLRRLVVEAAFSSTTAALTTGVILTAFALHLGANNVTIGLLAAIPFLSQLAQAPAIALVEHVRARKRIAVLSSLVGRSMLGLMALLPFAGSWALPGLVIATLILCVMGAMGGCAWNAWMRDLAPEQRMGSIFARRTIRGTLATLVAGLAAAIGLEISAEGSLGRDLTFSALYLTGCAAGLASAWIVAAMPEPVMAPRTERLGLIAMLRRPFVDRNFARLIVFLGSWQFAINLATPFFTVFLVRQLGYDMTVVVGLSIVSQLANIVALRNWGSLADRFTNKSVLLVAAPAYIASIVAMIGASQFTDPSWRLVWLTGLHIVMGAAVAGVTLASTNIALKLSPRGEATAYVAASGLVSAVSAGAAPILGGIFADYFAARKFELIVRWINPDGVFAFLPIRLGSWDFYFLLAGLLGLYALHRLSAVEETGEIERREMVRQVVDQTRSTIHNFSTVTGLKALTELPANLLRDARIRARFLRTKGHVRPQPHASLR